MKSLLEIFQVTEAYRLPDKIMDALLSDEAESVIREIKENAGCDMRDMFQQEQGDRKNLKQDFTPDCICDMVAKLMKNGSVLDMCSGTGALSKAAVRAYGVNIHEQEFSERTIPFALLDACIDGAEGCISRADCLRGTVAETYQMVRVGNISVPRRVQEIEAELYDNVIMNPPYSMKFPEADDMPIAGFKIPRSKADYGFVLRGLEHLKDGGRLIAILPHGVLFRGAGEGKIREWLIKEHLINAVIGLPDKLFLNTGIPVCLLILEKESPDVLFVDASKEFVKKTAQNDMTAEQIQKTVDAFHDRSEKERFAHVSGYNEIESNDCNLNIPRYVDTFVPEPLPNITELLRDLREIDAEEQQTKGILYDMLGQLTGGDKENDVIYQHRQILKPQMHRSQSEQITMEELYENTV
jgi:type I restriction enzyme M protein